MVEEEKKLNIIIDNGSGYIKAGINLEIDFRNSPTFVGYPKYPYISPALPKKDFYVGSEAVFQRGILDLRYPIEYGVINNWDDMQKIWEVTFKNELQVSSEEHNVLLTNSSKHPKDNREKMAQIMFETFKVPGLYIADTTSLPLYSAGKYNGVVVELGDGSSQFASILDGVPSACIRLDLGGRDLTKYLAKLLIETGHIFSNSGELEIVKSLKEKKCYVAFNYIEELKTVELDDYELPDGNHVMLKQQRIRCPEALFHPILVDKAENGIAQTCFDLIQKNDIDKRKDLCNFIYLSGGVSRFGGLKERFEKEIKALAPESIKEEIKVTAAPTKFEVWIGGFILSKMSSFESKWITKAEYEESGMNIVLKKCPF